MTRLAAIAGRLIAYPFFERADLAARLTHRQMREPKGTTIARDQRMRCNQPPCSQLALEENRRADRYTLPCHCGRDVQMLMRE